MARSKNRELNAIEDALGEEFESLKEARAALKRETGAVPFKDRYSVRELSTRKHRTIKTLLPEWESRAGEIDTLKKPSDFWAAEIYGHGTYSLYGTFDQLVKKLATYKGLQDEDPHKALSNIKIIQVKGINAAKQYYSQKKKEVHDSWRKRKDQHKRDKAREKRQQKLIANQAAEIKRLKKRLAKK